MVNKPYFKEMHKQCIIYYINKLYKFLLYKCFYAIYYSYYLLHIEHWEQSTYLTIGK